MEGFFLFYAIDEMRQVTQLKLSVRVGAVINKKSPSLLMDFFAGAKDEIRTRDPDLGKVVLYQLSYFRIGGTKVIYPQVYVNTFVKKSALIDRIDTIHPVDGCRNDTACVAGAFSTRV